MPIVDGADVDYRDGGLWVPCDEEIDDVMAEEAAATDDDYLSERLWCFRRCHCGWRAIEMDTGSRLFLSRRVRRCDDRLDPGGPDALAPAGRHQWFAVDSS